MENKIFQFEIKEFTDEGKFSGYLATFGNVDSGGDIVDPGAFKKTLRENKSFPLNWGHMPRDPDLVVGTFKGKEDDKGLFIDGEFFLDLEGGKKAYLTTKALRNRGVSVGLSMGYKTIKDTIEKIKDRYIRHLKEVKLNEGALTLFPMNPLASITSIKEEGNNEHDGTSEPAAKKDTEFVCASCGKTLSTQAPDRLGDLLKAFGESTPTVKPSIAERLAKELKIS